MGKASLLLLSMCAALASHVLAQERVPSQDPPTLYEYFTSGGITSGLTADTPGFFKLNGKDIRIISGALHYFRVHPSLWRDRLKKMRATGLNTVETYVPWNLHEPQRGVFDFGNGDNDMSEFLNIRRFIQMAKEEDLLVIFRPGPYICSEWDFGGLPSWLQRDPDMKVRTAYNPYLQRVKIYFDNLIPRITDLVFEKGGPIIAAQIENEYASFNTIDKAYLELIRDNYRSNGLECLYFTSDASSNGYSGSLEGVLLTANFQSNPEGNLNDLLRFQPNRPVMVMEYWAGWFDHWFEKHHTVPVDQFSQVLETILSAYNGSVNFYMFHGGTNFGFMAGANAQGEAPLNGYAADVTSYDYDCPLSESGDYTDKYFATQTLIEKYQVPVLRRPPLVPTQPKQAYPPVTLQSYLTFPDILERIPPQSKFNLPQPVSMEMLPMNGDSGQSYGYILYRTNANIKTGTVLKAGPVKDYGILMVNGEVQATTGEKGTGPGQRYLINTEMEAVLQVPTEGAYNVDILVENMARVNFGHAHDFLQQKGLPTGGVQLDGVNATDFEIYSLEFKSKWVKGLTNWRPIGAEKVKAPAVFRATLTINGAPAETFIDMSGWTKGIIFVNGFNIGRYFEVGPQQALYVPAALLTPGENTIIIFEQVLAGETIQFRAQPNLG